MKYARKYVGTNVVPVLTQSHTNALLTDLQLQGTHDFKTTRTQRIAPTQVLEQRHKSPAY